MGNLIAGTDIFKAYGENTVLNGVSVTVDHGEFVAVMGPSGSGKTTLMYALSGMDSIDGGEVRFDGVCLADMEESVLADLRRRRMGFVFQLPTLLKNLNLLDNIILPSLRDNRKAGKQLSEKAATLMEKMGIGELKERSTTQVSGGQLQRAGICRALMGSPDIIFGDEPTGSLNSKAAQEIMEILSGINAEGTAVMLVTHDAKVSAQAQRVLFMQDGAIRQELRFKTDSGASTNDKMDLISVMMRQMEI